MKKEIVLSSKICDLNERIKDKESEIEKSKKHHTNMMGYIKTKYENLLKEREDRHQRSIIKKTQEVQVLKAKVAGKMKEREELLERAGI